MYVVLQLQTTSREGLAKISENVPFKMPLKVNKVLQIHNKKNNLLERQTSEMAFSVLAFLSLS